MGTITIADLELQTRIGLTEAERAKEQRVTVSLSFPVDAASVAQADDVTQGIDYAAVREAVRELAKAERKTIERLAEDVAATVLKRFHPRSVEVTVTKFPFPDAKAVHLRITRP